MGYKNYNENNIIEPKPLVLFWKWIYGPYLSKMQILELLKNCKMCFKSLRGNTCAKLPYHFYFKEKFHEFFISSARKGSMWSPKQATTGQWGGLVAHVGLWGRRGVGAQLPVPSRARYQPQHGCGDSIQLGNGGPIHN